MDIAPETVIHRIRGCHIPNLRLSQVDVAAQPPGLSVMVGGTAGEAVAQMRSVFGLTKKWRPPIAVATTTADAIRSAGFEVITWPTDRFANHGRIVHALGEAGFTDANLTRLAAAFQETQGY